MHHYERPAAMRRAPSGVRVIGARESFEPFVLRLQPPPLFTPVTPQHCVCVDGLPAGVECVCAMHREHFPGDLAVYISHSNSFCAQYLPLPHSRFSPLLPPPCVSSFGPAFVSH